MKSFNRLESTLPPRAFNDSRFITARRLRPGESSNCECLARLHRSQGAKPPLVAWLLVLLLTLVAGALTVWGAEPPKRSTYYDGTQKIGYGSSTAFDSSVAMTIEAWVYRSSATACETIVSRNFHESYWFGFCSRLRFYRSGGACATASVNVPARRWTHVAVSYDGTYARFYMDGQLTDTVLLSNAGAGRSQTLWLGGDPAGYNFTGSMDEVRVWMRARTQAEIQADMWREVTSGTDLAFVAPTGGANFPPHITEQVRGILPRDLVVPKSDDASQITVDGNINLGFEYADAEQAVIRYQDGDEEREAVAYLKYRDDNVHDDHALYIAVVDLHRPAAGWDGHNSFFGVSIDPNFSRDTLAQPSDFRIRGWLDKSAPTWGFGDGAGNFGIAAPPSPSTLWHVEYGSCFNEFAPPCMEMRIDLTLLGSFTEADGICLGHFDTDASLTTFLAPGDAVKGSPATWARMTYGEASATLPRVRITGHVYDGDASRPIMGHTVNLYDEDAPSAPALYWRSTRVDGSYVFDVPVPRNHRLKVKVATCPDCRYLTPQIGSGTAPESIHPTEVVFPGCAGTECGYATVDFLVRRPADPVVLTSFTPDQGAPELRLSDRPLDVYPATVVTISGANLHAETRVFLSSCVFFPPTGGCVEGTDYYEARVVERAPDETWVKVEVPAIPKNRWYLHYKWMVKDEWVRTGYTEWSILGRPDQIFRIAPNSYPKVYGFEFKNTDDVSGLNEFEGVYGHHAFIDLGFCEVWDPLYLLYFAVYKVWMDNSNGSCNGMSATSMLMYQGDLNPESFGTGAYFPAGLPGGPVVDGNISAPKPDTYIHHDCSPDQPQNLWAHIRVNHGVQTSAEAIGTVLAQLDRGFDGDPVAVLDRIRSNPHGYVLSIKPAVFKGHVVTPYQVVDESPSPGFSRILIYDCNFPKADDRYIEINRAANTYRFPHGTDEWSGTGIFSLPIGLWRGTRHAPGLDTVAEFIALLVFGDADGMTTGADGGQFGWSADGTFTETWPDAKPISLDGGPNTETHNALLTLPNATPPNHVQVNVRGPHYFFNTMNGGSVLQLEQSGGVAGDTDEIVPHYNAGVPDSIRYTPQRTANDFRVRLGQTYGPVQKAVFDLGGFYLEGGKTVEFKSLPNERGVELRNDTGSSLPFSLFVNSVDGVAGIARTNVFAGSAIPPGAVQRWFIHDWPAATQLRSEIDLDRDGTPDQVAIIASTQATPLPDPPSLEIRRTNAGIELSWPVMAQAYYLESCAHLGGNTAWSPVTVAPVVGDGTNRITVPLIGSEQYFRLHR